MTEEEIISTFEGQKPTATIWKIEDGKVIYRTTINNRYKKLPEIQAVFFYIPFSDINATLESIVKVDDIIQWLVV
jgi:hypothetical protein